jgi:hypothetical protein
LKNESSPEDAWYDPIVAQVRQAREALFAEADYDIYEFCRRLAARQDASGHEVVKQGSASLQEPPVARLD